MLFHFFSYFPQELGLGRTTQSKAVLGHLEKRVLSLPSLCLGGAIQKENFNNSAIAMKGKMPTQVFFIDKKNII